jgi:tetratricopeptide (TPR) repeat protein
MNHCDAEAAGQATDEIAGPGVSAALYEVGLAHLKAGRHVDARLCCEQALSLNPVYADCLQLMGLIALQAQQFDHTVEWLSRAIRQQPKPEYLSTLGFALKQAGRLEDALAVLDKAVQLAPEDPELWKQLAGALVALNRPEDALVVYQQVLKLDPRHLEAAYACGVLLYQLERFEEALACFNLCIEWQGDHGPALFHRARTLRALKRHEECLSDYRRLYALSPDDPNVCNNIGDALLFLGRPEEGLEWFDRALALRPDVMQVLTNRALALYQSHRFDEAILAYSRLAALDPDDARSAWQLAHLHLQQGDFQSGWAQREARWRVSDFSTEYPKFAEPKWLGKEDISGKTILVCTDEGIGDAVQFARYVPMLAARGASIVLVVQEGLRALLSGLPRGFGLSSVWHGGSPAVRLSLPDHEPAAGLRHDARNHPTGLVSAAAAGGAPSGVERQARCPRRLARRPRLGRQPQAGQRPQPLDAVGHARVPSRLRCYLRQPAEGS